MTLDRAESAGLDVLDRFRRAGALLEGHFLLSSGLHSPVYFQSALLLQHPDEAEVLARELGRRIREVLEPGAEGPSGGAATPVVVAPALGGIVIGYELARALRARGLFTERENGRMTLRRGFRLEPGERVVVCEDVMTTGRSAGEVAEVVREAGARVSAIAALVHRGEADHGLGGPVVTLARLPTPSHPPERCPQCAAGLPLAKPGSRGTNAAALR